MFPLKDIDQAKIFPFWVILLILVNLYVFFLELTAINPDFYIIRFALIPENIDFFEAQTLIPFVTAQFLHGGFIHILSNMWFLWVFGKNLESRLGFLFPVFYIFSGVLGNITQYIIYSGSNIPIIGASGAVAGILGAYLAFFPRNKIKTFIFVLFFAAVVEIPVSLMLFYWLITQLFSSAAAVSANTAETFGGVAYFAHVGGFAAGWVIGKIISVKSSLSPDRKNLSF